MPILKFYTSPNQLSSVEKQDLATVLTSKYAELMPAFFVNIMFHELPTDSFYMAGIPTDGKFLRLTIEHTAVNWDTNKPADLTQSKRFLDFVGRVLQERFGERGWRFVALFLLS
ncbi:hypothetical protein HYALB_00004768 [Hymenoscyphus albidus]|uniref:Tautomerase cis-CaaD-like domain-containing protein n=1 Tax=Hymenoscyphus albidus TaxID=595503 RepID=A0A9N9LHU2_9HELO|nr:hypothetical protein HYALB_00004768 [Hymenoscyphus albidus]